MRWASVVAFALAHRRAGWSALAALAFASTVSLSRCSGERHQAAADKIAAADAAAKTAENATKADQKLSDSLGKAFNDSLAHLAAAKASADSIAAGARRDLTRISVVGDAKPPAAPLGETPIGGVAIQEPDSVAYVSIQRQQDPRVYTIPKFVADLGAELRTAIASKESEALRAEADLALARSVSGADSATMRDLRSALASRTNAESIAKSNAGQDCRVAFILPCFPRKVVAVGAFTLGAIGGGVLVHQLEAKK